MMDSGLVDGNTHLLVGHFGNVRCTRREVLWRVVESFSAAFFVSRTTSGNEV